MKMSNGDFSVTLSSNGRDELSDLAIAIQHLSDELNHLRQDRKDFFIKHCP